MESKIKIIPKLSELAAGESIRDFNIRKASELHEKLFGQRYSNLNDCSIFVPTYGMLVLKRAFYTNGGKSVKAYSVDEYAKLLDIPEQEITKLIDTTPQFFIFLHEERSVTEEIDMLVTVAARRLLNSVQGASVRDQAQALGALSKFSSLVSPDKIDEDSFGKLIDGIQTPEEVTEILASYGFQKKPDEKSNVDNIPTITELLGEDDDNI